MTTVLVGSVLAYVASGSDRQRSRPAGHRQPNSRRSPPSRPGRTHCRVGASGESPGAVGRLGLVFLISVSAWVGAFQSGAGGHHAGETPAPGVALPLVEERAPTADEEERTAGRALRRSSRGARQVRRPGRGRRRRVSGRRAGTGRTSMPTIRPIRRTACLLDPTRPETLVYAESPGGPILLGAMFQMPEIGEAGPAVGGPLTVWHAHDHVCFSLLPAGHRRPHRPVRDLSGRHDHHSAHQRDDPSLGSCPVSMIRSVTSTKPGSISIWRGAADDRCHTRAGAAGLTTLRLTAPNTTNPIPAGIQ